MGYGPGGEKYGDWREDKENEEKKIMAKETDVNFDYIPGQRYIVEIKDKMWIDSIFSKRLHSITAAQEMRDEYKSLQGMSAKIHDTKTGEVI